MGRLVTLALAVFLIPWLFVGCTEPKLSPQISSSGIIGEWHSPGIIYCGAYGTINGGKTVFVLTAGESGSSDRSALRVLSIDDQGTPQEVGSLETPLPILPLASPSSLALAGDVLYVPLGGSDQAGLWVVDVSNPDSPEGIAFVNTQHIPTEVALSGKTLAVSAMPPGTLMVFDIADPRNPRQVSTYTRRVSSTPSIGWADSLLCVADRGGLHVVDVSAPGAPKIEVGFYGNPEWDGPPVAAFPSTQISSVAFEEVLDAVVPPGYFSDLAVSEQYVYVAASDSGLRIIDVSDPVSPVETAPLKLDGRASRVTVSGDTVYVLEVYPGDELQLSYSILAVDVSDATTPELLERVEGIDGLPPYQSLVAGEGFIYLLNHKTLSVIKE